MSRVRPDVVGRRLEDRFVLVNLRSNRIYELNSTATILWELLDKGVEDSELESRMLEHFEVEPAELRRDIDATMHALADAGLVGAA